jgi:hypothetical protein
MAAISSHFISSHLISPSIFDASEPNLFSPWYFNTRCLGLRCLTPFGYQPLIYHPSFNLWCFDVWVFDASTHLMINTWCIIRLWKMPLKVLKSHLVRGTNLYLSDKSSLKNTNMGFQCFSFFSGSTNGIQRLQESIKTINF